MNISNNYLKSITSSHQFYSVNDTKNTSSGSIEYADTGMKTIKSGAAGASATARFLNKPILSVMAEKNKLTHLLKTGQVAAFSAELGAIKARAALVGREVAARMDVLRSSSEPEMAASLPLPADQRTPAGPAIDMSVFLQNLGLLSPDVQLDGAEQNNSLLEGLKNAAGGGSGPTSSWDICESVADAIGDMGSGYLDVFQQAVEKYADFYSDFSDFMAKLKDYMKGDKDGITILNATKFLAALQELMDKYRPSAYNDNSVLYPSSHTYTATKEECEAWCKEMGLDPDKCISAGSGGGYYVHIDTSPLQEIYDSVTVNTIWGGSDPGSIGDFAMLCNSAQWAAWQAGMDMQKDKIQTGMQTLTQKYSNANSTFDNLVKVLSSTISSLQDCDKGFLTI
ncbi:IpaD/SipD/SspD family type III secretion system needle tip protein [Cedecea davisae]|uniref:IpaD/SipD/SspD family type III secretion system needle tip protein n=1 Tax=Cedecea davisae TaxID=158484 RepID=UPI00376EF25E